MARKRKQNRCWGSQQTLLLRSLIFLMHDVPSSQVMHEQGATGNCTSGTFLYLLNVLLKSRAPT